MPQYSTALRYCVKPHVPIALFPLLANAHPSLLVSGCAPTAIFTSPRPCRRHDYSRERRPHHHLYVSIHPVVLRSPFRWCNRTGPTGVGFAILWTWCPPRIVVMHRALGCLENQRGSHRFRASRHNTETRHSRIALALSTDDLLGQYQPIVTALLGTQAPSQSS